MENQIIEKLYESYGRQLYIYLLSMCKNQAMAEDLLQETFVKAMLSLPDAHTNMRAWLYKVARNLCLNLMKQRKREKPLDDEVSQSLIMEDITVDLAIKNEKRRAMYKALSSLPLRQREVISLHYFSEIPLKNVGKMMGLSSENVRVLNYRAKKALKKQMEVDGYEI